MNVAIPFRVAAGFLLAVGFAPVASADEPSPAPEKNVVFFPPFTPLYGASLSDDPEQRYTINSRTLEPPEGLGNYANEFFYPPLSTRLYNDQLDTKLAQRIEAYLANRAKLVNELQNALVAAHALDPQAREQALRAFAAKQTPSVVAHEAEAEQLRDKIIHSGRYNVSWNRDRQWTLRDTHIPRQLMARAETDVVRAAAYYQAGLLPEQRGLLCEIIAIKERGGPKTSWTPTPGAHNSAVFFSPETARFRFSALPAELAAKVSEYTAAKDALKDELWDAVVKNDHLADGKRQKVFEKLADAQWPRLSRLAELAEEIRRDFASVPPPAPPPLPTQLPPDLQRRIDACRAEKAALDKGLHDRMREVAIAPRPVISMRGKTAEETQETMRAYMAERKKRIDEAETNFRGENVERYAALQERLKPWQTNSRTSHATTATPSRDSRWI